VFHAQINAQHQDLLNQIGVVLVLSIFHQVPGKMPLMIVNVGEQDF